MPIKQQQHRVEGKKCFFIGLSELKWKRSIRNEKQNCNASAIDSTMEALKGTEEMKHRNNGKVCKGLSKEEIKDIREKTWTKTK